MRLLIDAQLPARLAQFLTDAGHDVAHTSELPHGNRTPDADICQFADAERRVVVSKDRDFRDSHLVRHTPERLLIVATGNITNEDLIALFETHIRAVEDALSSANFVELSNTELTIHS